MAEEELKTFVKYYFETYGLSMTEDQLRQTEAVAQQLNTTVIDLIKNYREMNNLPAEGITRFNVPSPITPSPIVGQVAAQPSIFGGQMVTGNLPEAFGRLTGREMWEGFDRQFRAVSDLVGATSNLVHAYYWMESAQIRMENAQLRLANAQDTYNNAVNRYGASSQQALSAYRSMEVAENNLERAHAREILNIGLLGIQMVQMVRNLSDLARNTSIATLATELFTASNWKLAASQIAVALSNPATVIFGGIAMGAIAGLMAGGIMSMAYANETNRRGQAEIPQGQEGAEIIRGGLMSVDPGELLLSREQRTQRGGQNIINLGDNVFHVSGGDLEGSIDIAMDRQRWNVKNQLRRYIS